MVHPKCRAPYYPSAEFLELIHYKGDKRRAFARGEGCQQCHDTGFQGRIGIYEVLLIQQSLRELISSEDSIDEMRRWFRALGGRSLLDEGLRIAEAEITSLDEVMRVAFSE